MNNFVWEMNLPKIKKFYESEACQLCKSIDEVKVCLDGIIII